MSIAAELAKTLASALAGGLFGAWITIKRAKYSSFSSDFSKRLDNVFSLIDKMSDVAAQWWYEGSPSESWENSPAYILGLKEQLTTILDSISRDYTGFNVKSVNEAYIAFVEACTGGRFPSPEARDSTQISLILKRAELLKAAMFSGRRWNYAVRL
jgi:hypothetical protein